MILIYFYAIYIYITLYISILYLITATEKVFFLSTFCLKLKKKTNYLFSNDTNGYMNDNSK